MIELRTLGRVELRRADGTVLHSLLTAPKRLALLAYLVLARPPGFHRRDRLLALFWPEHDDRHARGALRNLLHMLRRSLGAEVLVSRGDGDVGIAPGAVWCDVLAFDEAMRGGRREEALDLYRGDLLAGFHVAEAAPELEHWLEEERTRLRAAATAAACELSDAARSAGDAEAALRWARRACEACPGSEPAFRRLVRALEAAGDRPAAVAAYASFVERLDADFGVPPSEETVSLVAAMRERVAPPPMPPAVPPAPPAAEAPSSAATDAPRPVPTGAPVLPPRRRRHAAVAVVAAACVVLALFAVRVGSDDRAVVMAVGRVQGFGEGGLAGPVADMLASHLSQVPGIRLVSPARMAELVARAQADGDTSAPMVRAARLGSIDELIEGSLHSRPNQTFQLDLRRVDLHSGEVRDAVTVEAADVFRLVERGSAALARGLQLPAPRPSGRGATTASPVAHRFYEEGVRAYYRGDLEVARDLLGTALEEDSTFAMASYYLGLATGGQTIRLGHFSRALRLASNAPERERLLINAAWALLFYEPSLLARAESLTVRYPLEPEGHYLYGRALMQAGEYAAALPFFEQVVAMDSAGIGSDPPHCRACDAFHAAVDAYMYLDSARAAERTARRWIGLQPRSARAWDDLAWVLWRQDRFEEALEARRQAAERRMARAEDEVYRAVVAVRAGEFGEADPLLYERSAQGRPEVQRAALYWLIVSLRHQGRLEEALVVAREYRRTAPAAWSELQAGAAEAQVLFELGRYREAAGRFDSMSAEPWSDQTPARNASRRVWGLAHASAAHAAAGDAATLGVLADSMLILARRTGHRRERVLHYYTRGLLLRLQGKDDAAVPLFRRAILSRSSGYPRPKVELARALIELGRPAEAVPVMQAALRGPIAGPGFHATRTELHHVLGSAWDAADNADSAASHYRQVVHAWQKADPQFHARREQVRRRLAELERAARAALER